MPKKQEFTDREIEKDIINALRNPPRQTKSSDTKTRIAAVIIACALLVIEILYSYFVFYITFSIYKNVFLKKFLKFEKKKNRKKVDIFVLGK